MLLPRDDNRIALQLAPATATLARTVNSTLSTAQSISLNALTTFIRVYATSQDVYLKWGSTNVTSSNFDEVIPAGQVVDLAVPYQTALRYSQVTLIERNASAAVIVIEK